MTKQDVMEKAKRIAAEKAVEEIREGMIVGLGTGSTSAYAIRKIGEMVREGLRISAVCTSSETTQIATGEGIAILNPAEIRDIDLAIDGADQVDRHGNLIKGGGGALLREKIVEYNSSRFLVAVDERKLVDTFKGFPLPVEIASFAAQATVRHIARLGCSVQIRTKSGSTFITDNGNYIADCNFQSIDNPAGLDSELKKIPGVIETGIFLNTMVAKIFVGFASGHVETLPAEMA